MPEQILAILHRLVDEQPGITLADLREAAEGIPADLINIAIAKHALSVDLGCYRLSEPAHTPVFRQKGLTLDTTHPLLNAERPLPLSTEGTSHLTPEGRALLEQAREADLATAVFRSS